MNRLDKKFRELKENNQCAFIGFVTLGDPDPSTSLQMIQALATNGCDIIELGLPFSDPAAEGPIIQAANLRALNQGMNTKKAMSLVKQIRETITCPILYSLYYNQIFRFGSEGFFKEAANAGIDGIIIPDLPYEYQEEIKAYSQKYGIVIISLITSMAKDRMELIASHASGFLYCFTPTYSDEVLESFTNEVKTYTNIPLVLNVGEAMEDIETIKPHIDGIIIDSVIVELVEKVSKKQITIKQFGDFIHALSELIH